MEAQKKMKYPPRPIKVEHLNWLYLIFNTDLPQQSKFIAAYLNTYMNSGAHAAWPSIGRMIQDTSMSKSSVIRYTKVLEEEGWLSKKPGGVFNGRNTPNTYTMIWPKGIGASSEVGSVSVIPPSSSVTPPSSSVTPPGSCVTPKSERESERESEKRLSTYVDHEVINAPPAARVPYQKIVDAYHDRLPELCQVRKLTETRKRYIKKLWVDGSLDDMTNWENFFDYVSESDFLMGKAKGRNGGAPWQADLEWITKPANFVKILEGKYNG